MKKALVIALMLLAGSAVMVSAEPVVKFYGYQWLNYEVYQVGASQETTADKNSFYIPRTYLRTSVKDDDIGIGGYLTLDINNVQYGQQVATTASAGAVDFAIWIKYGYVDIKMPVPEMTLRLGLQNFYFGSVDTWSYPIALSAAYGDRQKIVPASADAGVALVGLIPEGWGSYELALYNGSGYKKMEDNAEKMYAGNVTLVPLPGLSIRTSYLKTITNALNAATKDYSATGVVLGFASGPIEASVEYNVKEEVKNASASKSGVMEGMTAFLGVKVLDNVSVNFRYDAHNPDTGTKRDEVNYVMAGVKYVMDKNMEFQLCYELEQPKILTGSPNNDHKNKFVAQTKWSW